MIPAEARTWWLSLEPAARRDLERSWSEPGIQRTFDGHALPIWLEGDLHADEELEEMNRDLLEYILNHEVPFFLQRRVFHICRAHAPAHTMLRRGFVPGGFTCPVRGDDCPMRAMSKSVDGHRIRIRARISAADHFAAEENTLNLPIS